MKKQFLIWIPAYNEEAHAAAVISQLKALACDIVLSNAGSKDNTVKIAKRLGISVVERSGFGKGYAVKDALQYCKTNQYEHLILIDCDETYSASDVPNLIKFAPKASLVLGSRNLDSVTPLRRLANRMMTGLFNLMFQTSLKDVATGLRILKVSAFEGLINAKNFDVETEICSIAVKRKFKIIEVPVKYDMRQKGSKAKPSDLIYILWQTLYYRFIK